MYTLIYFKIFIVFFCIKKLQFCFGEFQLQQRPTSFSDKLIYITKRMNYFKNHRQTEHHSVATVQNHSILLNTSLEHEIFGLKKPPITKKNSKNTVEKNSQFKHLNKIEYKKNEPIFNNRITKLFKQKRDFKASQINRIKKYIINQQNKYNKSENKNFSKVRHKRAVTAKKERLWDYGVIPYEVDNIFSGSHKALFKQAMAHWENHTCIKFVERDPQIHPNYIFFTVRSCGCCSFVGKRGNGRQAISIGKNCEKFGIIVHELGHVIGFWHEHTRVDRDKHIKINRANIMKGQEYNFNVLTTDDVDSLGLPYDYGSIMHYARNTFSKSIYLDTILPIVDSTVNDGNSNSKILIPEIGQRSHLSKGDIGQANILYKCPKCGKTYQQNSGYISTFQTISLSSSLKFELNNETMMIKKDECEWRITATHGERIILNIHEMDIAMSKNCESDYLEIRDGYWFKSPLIQRLCGNEIPKNLLITNSNRMLLSYINNDAEKFKGFKASFKIDCSGEIFINENNHRIDSPNYPLEYPHDKECIWKVSTISGYQVALQFKSFEIENHDNCAYDFIEIRDGINSNAELIGIFCGYKLPPHIKSNSNSLYIRFVSDSTVQKSGFSAIVMKEFDECESEKHGCQHECINTLGSYECACFAGYELQSDGKSCEDACGGVIFTANSTEQAISSPLYPNPYPALKTCVWEIIAPLHYNIFLNFSHFDLEGSICGNYDHLTIYSKLYDDKIKKVGVFCGNELPPVIISQQNMLRLEFKSDKSIQKTGFQAIYYTDFDECSINNAGCQHFCKNTFGSYECSCRNGYSLNIDGHNCTETPCKFVITSSYGVIYSPNYPIEYPRNTYCYWQIVVTPGHRVRLVFNDFDLEEHQECIYDYVTVYDGKSENSSSLGTFCGSRLPANILASTNYMFLILKTDFGLQRRGFKATHLTECGGYLRATNQTQYFYSHPRFGHRMYKKNSYCIWKIQSDENSSVKLEFSFFEIEYSRKCIYDFVEIFEDSNIWIHSKNYGRFCGNKKPPEITSYSDTLSIRFQTDESTSLRGFSISYISVDPPDYESSNLDNEYDEIDSTPFPGYMKNIFAQNSNYYDEDEVYSVNQVRNTKSRHYLS